MEILTLPCSKLNLFKTGKAFNELYIKGVSGMLSLVSLHLSEITFMRKQRNISNSSCRHHKYTPVQYLYTCCIVSLVFISETLFPGKMQLFLLPVSGQSLTRSEHSLVKIPLICLFQQNHRLVKRTLKAVSFIHLL